MTTLEFLSYLRSLEVRVWAEGDKLRYKSRERVMTVALVDELAKHKGDILNLLSEVRVDTFGALPVIQPLARDGELPLSFAQQRLWFLDQLESNSAAYNIPTAVRLCGQLNITALERSFSEVVRRHESLRTTFKAIDGKPVQVISPPERVNLLVEQLSAEARADDYQVEQLIREEAGQAFDLARGPLFRVRLLRLHDSEHVFLLTMHHLISDGWSIGILIHELTELYKTFTSGGTSSLPELPVQYVDFAHWQREWLHGEVLDRQLSYWTQQLGGATAVLELPTDYPRPAVQSLRGARQNFILPEKLALELHGLCRREGVTLFMALLAAFEVLLSRYTAQTDISVGMPIAGRNRLETEALIGFFVNTLVLRVDVSGNPSVRELLARVRDVALGAHAHQDLPFEKLVEELRPERSLSYTPLFQVMFALNVPREVIELADLKLVSLDVESGTSKFDLSLIMEER